MVKFDWRLNKNKEVKNMTKYVMDINGTHIESDDEAVVKAVFDSVMMSQSQNVIFTPVKRKRERRTTRIELKEKMRLIKEELMNSDISVDVLAEKYRVGKGTIYKYCRNQLRTRTRNTITKRRRFRGHLATLVEDTVMSPNIPQSFQMKDLMKQIGNRASYKGVYGAINRMIRDKKLTKTGYMRNTYYRKNGGVGKKLFPTEVSDDNVISAIQAISKNGGMSYRDYGKFFGFDLRSKPTIEWVKLMTSIANYIQDNKMGKPVMDMNEMSLKIKR
jgi:hypothetical protein